MPNPHYQRVLEQDRQLPPPLRIFTRAMSSWWTIGVLVVFVVGYVALALVPLGGRYLWQLRFIDSTQQQVLTWWPLQAAAILLAVVAVWSALRRLPLRLANLGAFLAVFGFATILVSQSWAFRYQSTGIAAVPISQASDEANTDPLSLTYTTRFGDTSERVLTVMLSSQAPVQVPLTALPRWNDAAGDNCPTLKLHDDPKLQSALGYQVRITTIAYVADGTLTQQPDGTQAVTPTPDGQRNTTALPYPARALLSLQFVVDSEAGDTTTTTLWLPFEPEGTDSLVPNRFFNIKGLGSVGLAFRPMSKKLPFAMAGKGWQSGVVEKDYLGTIYIADSNAGRLLQPNQYRFLSETQTTYPYTAIMDDGTEQDYQMNWLDLIGAADQQQHALIRITEHKALIFITAGLITFLLGVVLDRLLDLPGRKRKTNPQTQLQSN